MTTYVAFLRGINVGGHNRMKMDALRALCEGLGHADVRTYIQSGNVVFEAAEADDRALADDLAAAIDDAFSYDVTVMVRTFDELAGVETGGGVGFECSNCGGDTSSAIWKAGAALTDPGWCDRIGREQQRRLVAAFEWAIGDRKPPPGLKGPRTEEEAREALEALL